MTKQTRDPDAILARYADGPAQLEAAIAGLAGLAIEPSLALFRAHRCHVVQLVGRIPDGWGRHMLIQWPRRPEAEPITVGDVIEMQADHTLHHIEDIRAIRQTHSI